jgi:HAD superfamily hydrolase (TIGR01509 family)
MQLPVRPSAVVFDMDGLLFDTETLYEAAIMAAAVEGGHKMTPVLFRRMLGGAWLNNRALLVDQFGAAFPVEAFRTAWMRHFDRMADTRLVLKPGAVELLCTLDELRLPRAIATSSSPHTVRHHLAAHGLTERFDAIVAHGDYVLSKPAPDPYLKAAERLGVEPRLCLALEDSFNGIQSASSAGMMVVMVPDLLEPTDGIRALCSFVADDLHVVRGLLLAPSSAGQTVPQEPPCNGADQD